MYIRSSYKNVKTSLPILKKRHVPRAKDSGKDNIVMIIDKNTTPQEDEFSEFPYYIARIQRKKRWFKVQYPNHRFIRKERDNPNSIHTFNRFEGKGLVETFQCHFRFADITGDALYTLTTSAIQK